MGGEDRGTPFRKAKIKSYGQVVFYSETLDM